MVRLLFIGLFFFASSFQNYIDGNLPRGRKETGWLVFKESGGALFARDSIPNKIKSKDFFNKVQYLNGVDVSNNRSIYTFEKYTTSYQALFWGNKNKERIKIMPVEVQIFSRKKSFDPERNAWAFKSIKDSTIILYNSPDTLYVSNICPYRKEAGDCYEAQTCSK